MPGKIAAEDILIYLFLIFRELKAWHFMWIVCLADNSHKMSSLIFLLKVIIIIKKRMSSAVVLNFAFFLAVSSVINVFFSIYVLMVKTSNEYPQHYVFIQKQEKYLSCYMYFSNLELKISILLPYKKVMWRAGIVTENGLLAVCWESGEEIAITCCTSSGTEG